MGPLQALPRELTEAESRLAVSSADFGLELFTRLYARGPTENVVSSPLSAFLALGLAANGADGATLAAMRTTLGLSELEAADANRAVRSLLELLEELDPGVRFVWANSVWHRLEFPTDPSFRQTSIDYFDARVEGLDFADPAAPQVINGWVAEATDGAIPRLIQQIDPQTVMFLINAISFKGAWATQFDPERTTDGAFTRADGSTVSVPMMTTVGDQRVRFEDSHVGLDLPYGRGAFVMTVVLPREGHELSELVGGLDAETWAEWTTGFSAQRIALAIPRMRLEWGATLADALKMMGMEIAFDPERADFGRLVEPGSATAGNLYITDVRQSTLVDVNEEGTEAAAATSVGIGVTSAPPVVRVDRPFLFAIRERFSGALLFLGAVADPTGSSG